MNDLLDDTERAALEAACSITTPVPKHWAVVNFDTMKGFDSETLAYGLIYVGDETGAPEEIDFDWAVVMKWDGWIVTLDFENTNPDTLHVSDGPNATPCTIAPPEVILHVMSEGARVILARPREVV